MSDQPIDTMEEALFRIASWADAYPLQVFPEPDAAYYAKADVVLRANDMTLDRLSAAAMRHVITQVGKLAKEALEKSAPETYKLLQNVGPDKMANQINTLSTDDR